MTTIGATDTRSIKLDKFSISDYKLDLVYSILIS